MNADEVSLSRDVWSRSGATAGRGFHYQDAVGAWWAARMLAAPGRGARIVPEGFEDLHIEGDDYVYIQVKSRQEPAGDFTARQVARFLAEMWEKHTIRIREGHPDGSMVLVLERPVAGCRFDDPLETLADLPSRHEIAAVLSEIVPAAQLEFSLGKSSILVLGWEDLSEAAMDAIGEAAGVMPSTSRMIERELRLLIAEAADANATVRRRQDTRGIDRLGAQAVVDGLVRLVDRASLEAALLDGTCDVVDFRLPETPDSFFEGMPAKPGHIAAGIPAARSSLVSEVLNALEMRGTALIAGPSGVGKSTLMWSTVYRRRDMVWYRINRLDGASVSKIVELARASRAGERAQVGFVVDGVGIGESQSWDQLQRSLAMHPGILLLGSVRHEDMFPLETIQDCGVITVSLDEEVAQEIHSKLVELGVTAAPHWREAYAEARGLTMEFTYLLSQGRRLPDVLLSQVRRRVEERREIELRLIALVATAHQWDVAIPTTLVAGLGIDTGELRLALARLQAEHLVVGSGNSLSGTHALRSRFLAIAVHSFPPPDLDSTIKQLLDLCPEEALPALVTGALRDHPETEPSVLSSLAARISRKLTVPLLTATLRAIRLAEFERRSQDWLSMLETCDVPPSLRAVTLQLSLLEDEDDANAMLLGSVQEAIAGLRSYGRQPSLLMRNFLAILDHDHIVESVLGCQTSTAAADLLTALSDMDSRSAQLLANGIRERGQSASPLSRVLKDGGTSEIGEVVLASGKCGKLVAETLLELAGGTKAILTKLRDEHIWVTDIAVEQHPEDTVLRATVLHVSDELQGAPEQSVRALARTALSCLPNCVRAEVHAFLPGEMPIEFGISRLQRRFLHAPSHVEMNRRTAMIAAAAFQTGTLTDRVATAITHLPVLREFLECRSRVWLLGERATSDRLRATQLQEQLREVAAGMVSVSGRREFLDVEVRTAGNDYLQTLFSGIVDNMSPRLGDAEGYGTLAAYVRTTLRTAVREVEVREDWGLLDQVTPPELRLIDRSLENLAAILTECALGDTPVKPLIREARSGPRADALPRAAGLAVRNAGLRHELMWRQRSASLRKQGLEVELHQRHLGSQAEGWPPVATAIELKVSSVFDWSARGDELVRQLKQESDSYIPPVILFPTVGGQRIDLLAIRLFQTASPYPALGQDPEWEELLPPSAETPLTSLVTAAHRALQLISGLAVMGTYRSLEPFQDFLHMAEMAFTEAWETILSQQPDDGLTQALSEVLQEHARLALYDLTCAEKGELVRNSLAESIGSVLSAEPSALAIEVIGMRTLALQADLDRDTALLQLP